MSPGTVGFLPQRRAQLGARRRRSPGCCAAFRWPRAICWSPLNQTIDLFQQVQSAVGQTLGRPRGLARDRPRRPSAPAALDQARERLEAILPRLAEGWRIMLRGSVAMSRAIPEMATQAAEAEGEAVEAALPPLAMAEDEDPGEAAAERAEELLETGIEPGVPTSLE